MTAMDPDQHIPWEEEPWEQEIAQLLAALPAIEPPPGFIEAAVDRPPHHFGRAIVVALGATAIALVGAGVFGLIGPDQAELSLDWMADRHETIASGMGGGEAAFTLQSLVRSDPGMEVVDLDDDPLDMPSDYEHEADLLTEDLRQAIYSRGNEAVSVFEQAGRIDAEALAADGLVPLPGTAAWHDPVRKLMVVETTDAAVAVVGLEKAEMTEVLADAEPRRTGPIEDAITDLTAQLGFPD